MFIKLRIIIGRVVVGLLNISPNMLYDDCDKDDIIDQVDNARLKEVNVRGPWLDKGNPYPKE